MKTYNRDALYNSVGKHILCLMLRNFNILATKICPVILGIDAAGATPANSRLTPHTMAHEYDDCLQPKFPKLTNSPI